MDQISGLVPPSARLKSTTLAPSPVFLSKFAPNTTSVTSLTSISVNLLAIGHLFDNFRRSLSLELSGPVVFHLESLTRLYLAITTNSLQRLASDRRFPELGKIPLFNIESPEEVCRGHFG